MPKDQPYPRRANRLLDRLPEAEYRRLLPFLKPVKLAFNQVLYEFRAPIDYAYFPTGAVTSNLMIMQDGSAIEVATVGNEGLVGYGVTTPSKTSPQRVIVQIGDGGLRIEVEALRRETRGARHSAQCWKPITTHTWRRYRNPSPVTVCTG